MVMLPLCRYNSKEIIGKFNKRKLADQKFLQILAKENIIIIKGSLKTFNTGLI